MGYHRKFYWNEDETLMVAHPQDPDQMVHINPALRFAQDGQPMPQNTDGVTFDKNDAEVGGTYPTYRRCMKSKIAKKLIDI